jgi:hypothetical protein
MRARLFTRAKNVRDRILYLMTEVFAFDACLSWVWWGEGEGRRARGPVAYRILYYNASNGSWGFVLVEVRLWHLLFLLIPPNNSNNGDG